MKTLSALALRRTELALTCYFGYTSVLAVLLPLPTPLACLILGMNASVVTSFFLLAYAETLPHRRFFSILRDWYPMTLIIFGYRQMGWFAPEVHSYKLEQCWVEWDRLFLNDLRAKSLIEASGLVLPSLLEASYASVYLVPYFAITVLYLYRHRVRVDRFLFPFALCVLIAYALFPYFPSEPPWRVFPGELFPPSEVWFRSFNLKLVGAHGIRISVFPSAHCSGALGAALAMRYVLPEKPWVWRFLLVLAGMIALGAVYGRYHYLVDAVAGLAIAAALVPAARFLHTRSRP